MANVYIPASRGDFPEFCALGTQLVVVRLLVSGERENTVRLCSEEILPRLCATMTWVRSPGPAVRSPETQHHGNRLREPFH